MSVFPKYSLPLLFLAFSFLICQDVAVLALYFTLFAIFPEFPLSSSPIFTSTPLPGILRAYLPGFCIFIGLVTFSVVFPSFHPCPPLVFASSSVFSPSFLYFLLNFHSLCSITWILYLIRSILPFLVVFLNFSTCLAFWSLFFQNFHSHPS